MTPAQEKARELVDKYLQYADANKFGDKDFETQWQNAKQCAIICCEEVIKVSYGFVHINGRKLVKKERFETKLTKHYKEVIEEINKL